MHRGSYDNLPEDFYQLTREQHDVLTGLLYVRNYQAMAALVVCPESSWQLHRLITLVLSLHNDRDGNGAADLAAVHLGELNPPAAHPGLDAARAAHLEYRALYLRYKAWAKGREASPELYEDLEQVDASASPWPRVNCKLTFQQHSHGGVCEVSDCEEKHNDIPAVPTLTKRRHHAEKRWKHGCACKNSRPEEGAESAQSE